jgi:hypothetical protein
MDAKVVKRKPKSPRQKAVEDLDKVFSLWIRRRDGNRCVLCGSTNRVQCGHLFSRVAYSTRWSEVNCHAQCANCNYRHEFQPQHFNAWFLRIFSQPVWDALYVLNQTTRKFTLDELRDLINHYRSLL